MLDITFDAGDPDAAKPFNKQVSTTTASTGPSLLPAAALGYKVDTDGAIELPVIGKIKVAGLTCEKLQNNIAGMAKLYMKDPMITVKLGGFNVTLLGEVRGPGTYMLSSEKTTILQALATAGDLPLTAKKYDVHLYRDYKGYRTVSKVDLTNKNLMMDKNLFQMRPNDVLIVKARRSSIFQGDFAFFLRRLYPCYFPFYTRFYNC